MICFKWIIIQFNYIISIYMKLLHVKKFCWYSLIYFIFGLSSKIIMERKSSYFGTLIFAGSGKNKISPILFDCHWELPSFWGFTIKKVRLSWSLDSNKLGLIRLMSINYLVISWELKTGFQYCQDDVHGNACVSWVI